MSWEREQQKENNHRNEISSSKEDITVQWLRLERRSRVGAIPAPGHLGSPAGGLIQPQLCLSTQAARLRTQKLERELMNTDIAGIQGRGQNAHETHRENASGREARGMGCRLSTWPRACPSVPGARAGSLWGRAIRL